MPDVTITTTANGPYLVSGPIQLIDADGSAQELTKDTIALCRCGASSNKPFCDGTHTKIGFSGTA
jgi:CDGSH-type Zn-finger protein